MDLIRILSTLERQKFFNKRIRIAAGKDARIAYYVAANIIDGPFIEGEDALVSSNTFYAGEYLFHVLRKPWSKGEKIISQNSEYAYLYARDILNKRWPEGEKTILTNSEYAYLYARDVIKGRWVELESAILKNPNATQYMYTYAKYILKSRWRKAEPYILRSHWSVDYASQVIKGPWSEAEPHIAKNAEASLRYARDVLHNRFPAGELAIMASSSDSYAYLYSNDIIKGRWPEYEQYIVEHSEKNKYGRYPIGQAYQIYYGLQL